MDDRELWAEALRRCLLRIAHTHEPVSVPLIGTASVEYLNDYFLTNYGTERTEVN